MTRGSGAAYKVVPVRFSQPRGIGGGHCFVWDNGHVGLVQGLGEEVVGLPAPADNGDRGIEQGLFGGKADWPYIL